MSNERSPLKVEKDKPVYFKTLKAENSKEREKKKDGIFLTKKLKRNGLLEKKTIKKKGVINTGRWTKEEHHLFMCACLKFGSKWKRIQEALMSRTTAQIRSHAQKFVIHLCKKYNIEMKSKRRLRFISEHLNYPYKRKGRNTALPLENMTDDEKRFILNFNFYDKKLNFDCSAFRKENNKKILFSVMKPEGLNNEELIQTSNSFDQENSQQDFFILPALSEKTKDTPISQQDALCLSSNDRQPNTKNNFNLNQTLLIQENNKHILLCGKLFKFFISNVVINQMLIKELSNPFGQVNTSVEILLELLKFFQLQKK